MAFPWQAAAMVASAAANVWSSERSNQSNERINEASLFNAHELQQNDFDFQRQMWNDTNNYNTPAAMAQRYREAGINPYLAMQNGSGVASAQQQTGSGGSVPSMLPMHPIFSSQDMSNVLGALVNMAEYRKRSYEADMSQFNRDHQEQQFLQDLAKVAEDTHYTKTQRENAQFTLDYLRARREQNLQRDADMDAITGQQLQQIQNENSLFELRQDLLRANVKLSQKQYSVLEQEIRESKQRIAESVSRIQSSNISNRKMLAEIDNLAREETERILRNGILSKEFSHYDENFKNNQKQIKSAIQRNLFFSLKSPFGFQVPYQLDLEGNGYNFMSGSDPWRYVDYNPKNTRW